MFNAFQWSEKPNEMAEKEGKTCALCLQNVIPTANVQKERKQIESKEE